MCEFYGSLVMNKRKVLVVRQWWV